MELPFEFHTVVSAIATVAEFVSLAFIPVVLTRRKEAPNSIAWILTLVFLPVLGLILFWFLGRDRVRRPARDKASVNLQVRDRLSHLDLVSTSRLEPLLASQKDAQRGVMRLAAAVTRMDAVANNDVDVLVGAEATYDAHIEAIESARDHVHVEFYIFRPDNQGGRFRDALERAARRGVRVRVLTDGFGSRALHGPFMYSLIDAGAHVETFLPLDPIRRAWTINLRNHRKLMVVDGEIGFAGGINIGDEFLPWQDLHLRIQGPAVHQLQAIFVEDWFFASRYDLIHPAFFPDIPAHGDSVLQFVGSGPDSTVESIHRLYFTAISSARERVYLTTPYFVPDRALVVALQTAALRGVDVRLILPRASNHRVTFHAGRSYYEELLDTGVRIHEYLPNMLHTKTMIVDGSFATIGSANLDVRSFRLNFELIAVLWDRHSVGRLEEIFEEDLSHTEPVDPERWRRRGRIWRLKEGFGRLCAPLL